MTVVDVITLTQRHNVNHVVTKHAPITRGRMDYHMLPITRRQSGVIVYRYVVRLAAESTTSHWLVCFFWFGCLAALIMLHPSRKNIPWTTIVYQHKTTKTTCTSYTNKRN